MESGPVRMRITFATEGGEVYSDIETVLVEYDKLAAVDLNEDEKLAWSPMRESAAIDASGYPYILFSVPQYDLGAYMDMIRWLESLQTRGTIGVEMTVRRDGDPDAPKAELNGALGEYIRQQDLAAAKWVPREIGRFADDLAAGALSRGGFG